MLLAHGKPADRCLARPTRGVSDDRRRPGLPYGNRFQGSFRGHAGTGMGRSRSRMRRIAPGWQGYRNVRLRPSGKGGNTPPRPVTWRNAASPMAHRPGRNRNRLPLPPWLQPVAIGKTSATGLGGHSTLARKPDSAPFRLVEEPPLGQLAFLIAVKSKRPGTVPLS